MDIPLSSDALDVAFHPDEDKPLIAAGLISGKVQLFDYSGVLRKESERVEGKLHRRLWSVRPSHKSCRGVAFNDSGSSVFSIFKDKSLMALDPATGDITARWSNAHEYVFYVFYRLTQIRSFSCTFH